MSAAAATRPHLLARWPLRRLLAFAFLALCALLLISLGVAQYFDLRYQLERSVESQLRSSLIAGVERVWPERVVRKERGRLPTILLPSDCATRAEQLAIAAASYTVLTRVYSVDGKLLGTRGGPRDREVPVIDFARVREAAERAPESEPRGAIYFPSTADERWEMLVLPLRDESGKVACILVGGTGWMRYTAILNAMVRDIAAVGAVLFLLAILLSGWLARVLTRPLDRLAETAGRIGAGDLDARTGLEPGRNELYAVGRELDRMADRVQETFTAQQRFVEDASHELRTPLTILGGTADVLGLATSEEQRARGVDTITREVAKMRRLVEDLLLLARSRNARMAREEFDLGELLEDVREYALMLIARKAATVQEGAGRAEQAGLHAGAGVADAMAVPVAVDAPTRVEAPRRSFEVAYPAGSVVVGDRSQIERAVRNLVDNAIRYTREDGHIEVKAAREARGMRIAVKDDGAGISEADLPHVFDRFYRADSSRARKSGGSGLGLAIFRSIVEMHGGECGIDSKPGVGTTVWMLLP